MIAFTCVPSPAHHDASHPEHPRRLAELSDTVRSAFGDRIAWVEPSPAAEEAVLVAHPAGHLDFLRRACAQAPAIIDYAPTYVSPGSYEAAFLAAGATLGVLQAVVSGAGGGFAAIRPPGHHATSDRAMGFCLLNNVAIAARVAQAAGLRRVMIVDFDVHHGNGTQSVFEADPSVLYLSTHQEGIYPGTGRLDETGLAAGQGHTVNVPLPAGVGEPGFEQIGEQVITPLAERFRPDLLLVSAGFDAHWRDPLAGLRLTTASYHRLASLLVTLARRLCSGRVVFALEGGYHPPAVREGVLACLAALAGQPLILDELGAPPGTDPDVAPILRAVRSIHNL